MPKVLFPNKWMKKHEEKQAYRADSAVKTEVVVAVVISII